MGCRPFRPGMTPYTDATPTSLALAGRAHVWAATTDRINPGQLVSQRAVRAPVAKASVSGRPGSQLVTFEAEGHTHEVKLASLPELFQEDEPLWTAASIAIIERLQSDLTSHRLPPLFLWRYDWSSLVEVLQASMWQDCSTATSYAQQIAKHLLFLDYARQDENCNVKNYYKEVMATRRNASKLVASKNIRQHLEASLEAIYANALEEFEDQFGPSISEDDPLPALTAAEEGVTIDNIFDVGWWPDDARPEVVKLQRDFKEKYRVYGDVKRRRSKKERR